MSRLLRCSGVVGLLACLTGAAQAQEIKSGENPDPVYVFNRICYAQVPDIDAIRKMATTLAWQPMPTEDLKEFKTSEKPDVLEGWDAQVGERLFRVGLTQTGLTDKMKKSFPAFAGGKVVSCSVVLDDQQQASLFMPNMGKLAGRDPISRDVPEGLLRTTTWAGGSDDLRVFLFAKTPSTGKGGLLNVTLIQK